MAVFSCCRGSQVAFSVVACVLLARAQTLSWRHEGPNCGSGSFYDISGLLCTACDDNQVGLHFLLQQLSPHNCWGPNTPVMLAGVDLSGAIASGQLHIYGRM